MHTTIDNPIQASIALDDSCQQKLWVKGDLRDDRFRELCEEYIVREYGVERTTEIIEIIRNAGIERTYRRCVPLPADHPIGSIQYVDTNVPGRGAFRVMTLEDWIPIHF